MQIDATAALTRAATHLDGAVAALQRGADEEIPLFFSRWAVKRANAEFTGAAALGERALRELDGLGAPLEDARTGIRRGLDILEARTHKPYVAYEYKQGHVLEARLALDVQSRRLRLLAELDGTPAATVQARMQAELDGLVALPDAAIGNQELWRIGLIGTLPAHLRPRIPPSVNGIQSLESAAASGHAGTGIVTSRELDNIRFDVARRAMEADPGATRAAFTEELRAIVTKERQRITPNDVDRISVMAGLPDRLRPTALDAPTFFPDERLDQMGAWRWDDLARDVRVRAKIEAVRRGLEVEDALVDPSMSRDDVLRSQALRSLTGADGMWKSDVETQIRSMRDLIARNQSTDPAIVTLRSEARELADRNLDRMAGLRSDTYASHPDYAEVGRLAMIGELLGAIEHAPQAPSPAAVAPPAAADAAEVLRW